MAGLNSCTSHSTEFQSLSSYIRACWEHAASKITQRTPYPDCLYQHQ